uniref:Uncharacterized protein n=1 Tax=Anguilla anguilla TaxID=7936 RepID=A0A0E9R851_ANGAN
MVFITLLESKCEITHTRTHTHITKNKSAVSVISHFDSKRVMKDHTCYSTSPTLPSRTPLL